MSQYARTSQRFSALRYPTMSQGAARAARAGVKISRFMIARMKRGGRRRMKARYSGIPTALVPYQTLRNRLVARPHRFCKTIFNAYIVAGAGATVGGVTTFNLSGANAANFAGGGAVSDLAFYQGLYRTFRINKIILTWRARFAEFTDTVQYPELYTRYNYDPNAVITGGGGVAQFDGWENTKTHKFTNESPTFEYTIYPKVQKPLYAYTGVATSLGFGLGIGSGPQPWLDLGDVAGVGVPAGIDVPWWGYAYYFSNIPSGQSMACDIEFQFECKDQI